MTSIRVGEALRKSTKSSARFKDDLLAIALKGRALLNEHRSRYAKSVEMSCFPDRLQTARREKEAFIESVRLFVVLCLMVCPQSSFVGPSFRVLACSSTSNTRSLLRDTTLPTGTHKLGVNSSTMRMS